MLLKRQFFNLYEREVKSYEKLIDDLLINEEDILRNLCIDPNFLADSIKMEINLRAETVKIEDRDSPSGLENARAKELLEARKMELLEFKKEASNRKWIKTNYDLAKRLKSKIISEKICVVIGYSFRDEHIRSIFFDAVKRNPKIRIILIDKQPDNVMENLNQITQNVETIKGGFGEENVFETLEQKLARYNR